MADHLSLQELGIRSAADITSIGLLDANPPPGPPFETLRGHLPATAPAAAAPQQQRGGWENIFNKTPGMGA